MDTKPPDEAMAPHPLCQAPKTIVYSHMPPGQELQEGFG